MASIVTWQNGAPEISPLTTIEDLLVWRPSPEEAGYCQTAKPLPSRRAGGLRADRPRLLSCHDFRGNYLEDRFLQGGRDAGAYFFKNWDKIDGFCYFSHKLVTIPPPGWISAAHSHGVPILGTLITEWEAGEAACCDLLASDATAEHAAHQLAALASFLGFEGWVINIENDLSPSLIPRLLHFLKCLTKAVHSAVPSGGYVIWYDAVTTKGRLQWQNALTPLNAPFFDACDGIWINYTWSEMTPAAVRAAAGDRGWDVYMGIDAFGRGTYGGGGLGCDVALAAARRQGLSAALFACAWPYEKHLEYAAEDAAAAAAAEMPTAFSAKHALSSSRTNSLISSWQPRDDEFWKLIGKAWGVKRAMLCSLPFFTDFSTGSGTALLQAGQILWPAAWFNLSFQSLIPSIAFRGKRPSGLRAKISPAAAFNGGTSVVLSGTIQAPVFLRLFRAAAAVPREGLRVRFTAAVGSGVQLSLCLRLRQRRPASEFDSEKEVSEGELQLELYTTAGMAGGRLGSSTNIESGGGSSGGIFPSSQSHAVKLSSQATTTPFTWLPSEDTIDLPRAASPESHNNNSNIGIGGGSSSKRPDEFSNVPIASLPKDWTTWQFAIGSGDLPGWDLANSVLASVEVLAAPKSAGVPSPCNVFLGAISIAGLDDKDSPPSCPSVFNLGVDTIAVKRLPQAGGGTAAVLSAVLEWKMAPWIEKCHIWARIGKTASASIPSSSSPEKSQSGAGPLPPSSSPGNASQPPTLPSTASSSPDISPIKQPPGSLAVGPVAWGPPLYVGTSCGTAFGLNNFVLPEDTIAVRVYVATATWATMQPLRNATAQSIVLPPGITSPIHQHMH